MSAVENDPPHQDDPPPDLRIVDEEPDNDRRPIPNFDPGPDVDYLDAISRGAFDHDPPAVTALVDPYLDWGALFRRDRSEEEWTYPGVLARGRGHALYAAHKVGKSLLLLWIMAHLATDRDDVVVVYLDFEMTEDDVRDRLEDMGYGPDTDLSRLRYALLPALPPLDTERGGAALDLMLDGVQAEHPGRHLVVVIDTTSRVISGKENDSDTFIAFYRHTGIRLKRRGATWARLDHAGKDPDKAQRGSSAKGDDVDIVWRMTATQDGVKLAHHGVSRIGWAPESTSFHIARDPLRYVPVSAGYPAGAKECAGLLEELGVDPDLSANQAAELLRQAEQPRRREVVQGAVRYRRDQQQ